MGRLAWWVSVGAVTLACGGKSTSIGHDGSGAASDGATGGTGASEQRDDGPGDDMPPASATGGTGAIGGTGGTGGTAGAPSTTGRGGRKSGNGGEPATVPAAGSSAVTIDGTCPSRNEPAMLELPAWTEPMPARTPEEAFDAARQYIVGNWRGIASTPWVVDYEVSLWFDASGHYGGRCAVSDQCCVAFYYGTDGDCDGKRYSIDDATLSGSVTGTIDIAFNPDTCALPSWQGELSHVDVDAYFDRLRFDFETSDGYGPVHFELERVAKESPKH